MIIYNTTYHVELSTVDLFIDWVKGYYAPLAIKNGILTAPRLLLIMAGEEDDTHKSYSLQFEVESVDHLQRWYELQGVALVTELEAKFAKNVIGFSTIMSVMDL